MCETGLDLTKMDGIKASGANRGTHHGDYSDVPQQLLEGGAQTLAKPLHPYMDPKRQVTKALPGMHLVHKRILLSDEGRKLTECEAHMRRANQRGFKDEFLPRIKWEGAKEGYYFTTGFRGTGYYLDDTWCEYNDPDEYGYVLVRAAPAVAMHRVLPKRGKVGKQGLLFDKELLDALGPAHGKPPHRYKLITPPWLCEMKPPKMKFEKENMMQGTEVKGSNQMLKERVEWIAWRMQQVSKVLHDRAERKQRCGQARFVYKAPKAVVVKHAKGALARADVPLTSDEVGVVPSGATCVAVEEALNPFDGKTSRVRLASPLEGWVSLKPFALAAAGSEAAAEFGSTQKARRAARTRKPGADIMPDMLREMTGSSASNPRLVADFGAELEPKKKVDVAALVALGDPDDPVDDPDDDDDTLKAKALVRAIVALPAACGEVAYKGEYLAPVITAPGPWTVLLEFGGVDAFDKPLAFKATVKKGMLAAPVTKLLETFAKKHAAKYPGDRSATPPWEALDAASLRLYAAGASDEDQRARRKAFKLRKVPSSTDPHLAPDTLLCEVLEDLDPGASLHGAFVVRRRLGAGRDSEAVVSARSKELAVRAEERGPEITEWSSQIDMIRANAKKGWGEPQTSEEIREYWEQQKNYKHWRTTAALKGFTTRTDDEAKLEKWSKTLIPQAGYLENPDRKPAYSDRDLARRKERDETLGSSEAKLQTEGSVSKAKRETVQGDVRAARKKAAAEWRAKMVAEGKLTEANKFEGLVQAIDAAVQEKVKEKEEKHLKKKMDEHEAYWGHPMSDAEAAKLRAEVCKNSLANLQRPDDDDDDAGVEEEKGDAYDGVDPSQIAG